MGIFDRFRKPQPQAVVRVHDADQPVRVTRYGGGRTKYGNLLYSEIGESDHFQQRANARGVHSDSLIARGLVTRLVDNVINSGLTLESTPFWPMIPQAAGWSDEEKRAWTSRVEGLWKLWAGSTEPDFQGRSTFGQLQRLLYRLLPKEGEHFILCRYSDAPGRTSTLNLQILNNDQIFTPYDSLTEAKAKARGAVIRSGVEYGSDGTMSAVYVSDAAGAARAGAVKRIPVREPKSGRRFVIHAANMESPEQARGFPELAAFIYELDRLTEYDISELEAVIAGSLWFAAIETAKGASTKGSRLIPAAINAAGAAAAEPSGGDRIQEIQMGKRALLMQQLQPGQSFKGFAPNRPNPNFGQFEEIFEGRIAGSMGMPLSVFRQKFGSNYSASRAEILFFWNSVQRRRADFQDSTLSPIFEAWFSEHVRSGAIEAPGFETSAAVRRSWLAVSWNGISRPVVDPKKEAESVGLRQKMGHTTGEREARAFNGSDFMTNVERLKAENREIAEANAPLGDGLAGALADELASPPDFEEEE